MNALNLAQMQEQTLQTLVSSDANPIAMGSQALRNIGDLGRALGANPRADSVSRALPPQQLPVDPSQFPGSPWIDGGSPIASLMQQLQQLMSELGRMLGGGGFGFGGFGSEQDGDGDRYFNAATAGSNGDPHLSFNGKTWDSMTGHADLLSCDSIPGGFRISTETTPPDANGVTCNREATIATNFGNSAVSMDNTGAAYATVDGEKQRLQPGQNVQLGSSTYATCNADGSLTVVAQNERGGLISTTLRRNGSGVDVNASAQRIDLGGDLVAQNAPGAPAVQTFDSTI